MASWVWEIIASHRQFNARYRAGRIMVPVLGGFD